MMKRIKSTVLSMILVLSAIGIILPVQAANVRDYGTEISNDGDLDLPEYQAEYDRLVKIGESVGKLRFVSIKTLAIPRLQQSGQSWSDHIMQSQGYSIGSKGCALTCFTMVQRHLGGTDDPGQVNTKLGNLACDLVWPSAGLKYGMTLSVAITVTNGLNDTFVKGSITDNKPIIVCLKKSDGSLHFVLIIGYAYDEYIIRDPASTNYTYLSEYLNEGRSVVSARIYTK